MHFCTSQFLKYVTWTDFFKFPKKKSFKCSKAWIITLVFKDESSNVGNVMCCAQAHTDRKRYGQEGESKVCLCCIRAHSFPKVKFQSNKDKKGIFLDLFSYLRLEFYFSLVTLHKHAIFKNIIWTLLMIYQRKSNYPKEELLTLGYLEGACTQLWMCRSLASEFTTMPTNGDKLSVKLTHCLTFLLWRFLTIK